MSPLPDAWRAEAGAIEAVLIAATEPVPTRLLAELLEVGPERVEELCRGLAAAYEDDERGFELARVAGGYRFQSHPAYRSYVERFVLDDAPQRLSPAALETLAIVAYKQPISRAQLGAIRGVNVEGVMRVLVQRGYVAAVGRDDGPGQAILFGTTPAFLERLGLGDLGELPPLERFVPETETVEAFEAVLRPDATGSDATGSAVPGSGMRASDVSGSGATGSGLNGSGATGSEAGGPGGVPGSVLGTDGRGGADPAR